jgi:hypothetical protein
MVNLIEERKGWLRVLEASIAILIVLSVLFVVTRQNSMGKGEIGREDFGLLEQVLVNDSVRNDVLNYKIGLKEDEEGNMGILKKVMESVAEKLPPNYGYEIKICGALENCDLENKNVETISEERILSASLSKIENPIKIKMAYWPE